MFTLKKHTEQSYRLHLFFSIYKANLFRALSVFSRLKHVSPIASNKFCGTFDPTHSSYSLCFFYHMTIPASQQTPFYLALTLRVSASLVNLHNPTYSIPVFLNFAPPPEKLKFEQIHKLTETQI